MIGGSQALDIDLFQSAGLRIHSCLPELLGVHLTETFIALHDYVVCTATLGQCQRSCFALLVIPAVLLLFTFLDQIQWRLSDVDTAILDQWLHVSEHERQQQGSNVATVNVRVGHDDNAVIAQFVGLIFLSADTGSQHRN